MRLAECSWQRRRQGLLARAGLRWVGVCLLACLEVVCVQLGRVAQQGEEGHKEGESLAGACLGLHDAVVALQKDDGCGALLHLCLVRWGRQAGRREHSTGKAGGG